MCATKRMILTAIITLIVLISGCDSSDEDEASKLANQALNIGIDVFPGWGHAFIAREQGYFKAHGVDINLVHKTDYLDIVEDYANGQLDGAFLVFADAIFLNDQGIPTKVPYISDHSIKGDVIYALPEVTSIKDWVGKTVGVEGINSFSHLFVLSTLKKHGLKEGDVYFKNINAKNLVQEIEEGNIVAGHTYGPGRDKAKAQGLKPLAFSGDVKGIITDVLAVRANVLKQRGDAIERLIAALFQAKSFQTNSPDQAYEIIAEVNADTALSVKHGIDSVQSLSLSESVDAMAQSPEGELYQFGNKIGEFYHSRGQISELPNLKQIIDDQFVRSLSQSE